MKSKLQKRVYTSVLVVVMLLLTVFGSACNKVATSNSSSTGLSNGTVSMLEAIPTEYQSMPKWTISVQGVDGITQITSDDFYRFPIIEKEASKTNSVGTTTTNVFKGVILKDILTSKGIAGYQSVSIVATDDYSVEYTPEIINASDTMLVTIIDGAPITDGPRTICPSQSASMWMKMIGKFVVHAKGEVSSTASVSDSKSSTSSLSVSKVTPTITTKPTVTAAITKTPTITPTGTPAPTAKWTLIVTGGTKAAFTDLDLKSLTQKTVVVTKNNVSTTYTGALLTDVISFIGGTDKTAVTFADEVSASPLDFPFTTAFLATAPTSILALTKDGVALTLPCIAAEAGLTGKQSIKDVTNIFINNWLVTIKDTAAKEYFFTDFRYNKLISKEKTVNYFKSPDTFSYTGIALNEIFASLGITTSYFDMISSAVNYPAPAGFSILKTEIDNGFVILAISSNRSADAGKFPKIIGNKDANNQEPITGKTATSNVTLIELLAPVG